METFITNIPQIPDPITRARLIANLRQTKSPLIGSFHGDPQLSAQSEEIVHSIWQKQS